ncbi:AAA family ATPase [Vibrio sp.]|uniref:AAA family ATPase n=1 Tax=Vibrio sp. TaxID=678 RepID=UPI003F6AE2D1
MKVQSVTLKNFKRFEEETFNFDQRFTVLIGNNATGKSSILEAVAIFAGSYLLDFGGATKRPIRPGEVREKMINVGEVETLEPQYPVAISGQAKIFLGEEKGVQLFTWSRELLGVTKKTTRLNAKSITKLGKQDAQLVQLGGEVTLPLLAYYGTGRLWDKKRDVKLDKPDSREVGYRDCLDPQSNHTLFEKWFKRLELAALQKKKEYGVLEAVRDVIRQCIPGCRHFYFDIALGELVVELKDQGLISFSNLSDGYRNMIAIIADITHRAARLNPQYGRDVAKKIRGVVLIDEIDLHLHPKWQRTVVDDLKRAFPLLQFIATTHSPFVVQSMQPGEVVDLNFIPDLERSDLVASHAPKGQYVNRSIEDIVEEVMDVPLPSRSARLQNMFDAATEYYQVLEEAKSHPEMSDDKKKELQTKLDALTAPFSEDVAYHAFLNMERLAARLELEDKTSKDSDGELDETR